MKKLNKLLNQNVTIFNGQSTPLRRRKKNCMSSFVDSGLSLVDIPGDVFQQLLDNLEIQDVASLALVCKLINKTTQKLNLQTEKNLFDNGVHLNNEILGTLRILHGIPSTWKIPYGGYLVDSEVLHELQKKFMDEHKKVFYIKHLHLTAKPCLPGYVFSLPGSLAPFLSLLQMCLPHLQSLIFDPNSQWYHDMFDNLLFGKDLKHLCLPLVSQVRLCST
ncbi:hypothetical protein RFI_22723 [Reticulomyxa filosa]|uniref:F-box domain-containing protein n=1 Tax=Reticulomyxa filosa TaxID=46433 RepID=X6MKV2_RETFI|nr:hypothetical protein RFI_22723 [Reticulomyxa filosa]|eukprot:ETO14643.1 hypothetical protein RFI_22723 [Reticulomyxa filosa]